MIPYYLLDEKPVNIASIDTDNYFKNPFLMIVCISVAPVLEELLFRKYLWSVLIKVFNEKVYSAFLSSCMFGFLHFSQYTLPLIAGGLVFCWLYHKTEKIIFNIIVHSSYNITLLLIIHFLMR
ncbi:CPBP family intramembrane metalloprotease [Staphylococcus pseudintermedius]|nr:CPBP family intramembrane glutamic endopeptidase [Staphylococcus pseudintermedius]EGQ0379817.1 CPBP family intramembrane metalloprotease [Staphylococcus pseudintermedius]MBJ8299209.1 CPBP family intramembrane metalloprotease [Staphylococcus pseudintermedius]MDT0866731.1 CPBP family intramembrane glutamic endopeptidase [Staphylococcus pseudintermedius]HCG2195093.1 CPBP family intramembrane metalloprotease [Staphylococcus pseudintermedius]